MRSFDVVIVGAGIIGSAIALRLAQEKIRVALLDRQQPGREASWAAAGMLSPAPDHAASIPLVPFGRASLNLYPGFVAEVEEISRRRTGYRTEGAIELLFSSNAERELSTLVALHHGLGLATEPLPVDEARKLEPALEHEIGAAALLPYEACIDNRLLTEAVLQAARISGAELYPDTHVTSLILDGNRCTGAIAAGDKFSAGKVVIAAGAFSARIGGLAKEGLPNPVPTRPIRGQMAALRSSSARLRHVIRSGKAYLVPRDDEASQRIVTGSTLEDAGFEKRVTPRGLEQILSAAQEMVPGLGDAEIVEVWSGLRPDTPDHLPLLGPADIDGVIVATGHYRNGILLTPITAKLVREWIVEGRVSMDWEIFSPLRFRKAKVV